MIETYFSGGFERDAVWGSGGSQRQNSFTIKNGYTGHRSFHGEYYYNFFFLL